MLYEVITDEDVLDPGLASQTGGIESILVKDGRFGVGIGDADRAGAAGRRYDRFRRKIGAGDSGTFMGPLGDLVVLAVQAVQVAADRGDGKALRAGMSYNFV